MGSIDFALVPAIEDRVHTEIDALLKKTLYDAVSVFKGEFGEPPDARLLFRLAFGLLSAKILHDRKIRDFDSLQPDDVPRILSKVNDYYNADRPVLGYRPSQQVIAEGLWHGGRARAHLHRIFGIHL